MNIPVDVHIRRNADGVVRIYHFAEYGWDDDTDSAADFMWSDGNYACDCNREIFFERSVGNEAPDRECGDGAFSVCIKDAAGKTVYRDDDWETVPVADKV